MPLDGFELLSNGLIATFLKIRKILKQHLDRQKLQELLPSLYKSVNCVNGILALLFIYNTFFMFNNMFFNR